MGSKADRELLRNYLLLIVFVIVACTIVQIVIPTDDTDKSRWTRSGLSLYTDHKTGLQYIQGGFFGGTIPRVDENGKHMKVKR